LNYNFGETILSISKSILFFLKPFYSFQYNTHCSLNNLDRVNYFKYLFEHGFEKKYLKSYLYPKHDISDCMMRKVNSFGIEPEGSIYKCLEDFGNNNQSVGNINKGIINNNLLAKYTMAYDVFDDEKCVDCSFLPICGGGCPYDKINNDIKVQNCTYLKESLTDFLKMYNDII